MNKGTAMAIVKNINSAEYTDTEKAHAIYLVMNMATHMSITKDELINAIKWLWHYSWEFKEETADDANTATTTDEVKPCIYKHTCGHDFCMMSECPEYEPKTKGKKWFEEVGEG